MFAAWYSFWVVSEAQDVCRDVFVCLGFQNKDTLLRKDLACELLLKTSCRLLANC